MIAVGTDVKTLECLLFMRDVKSRNYFEQMKGRGTRTISLDKLRQVSRTAKYTKDHFVIVDAIGVCKSLKTDSRPLEKKPGVPLKDLLQAVAVGARDEDLFTSLASRLTRLDKQITDKERKLFAEKADGKSVSQVVKELLNAFNPDVLEEIEDKVRKNFIGAAPNEIEAAIIQETEKLQHEASRVFTGELNEYIENVRKAHEQRIDLLNPDEVLTAAWDKDNVEKAKEIVKEFSEWMLQHKDVLTALQIFYNQPYRRRELTFTMIKEVMDKLQSDKPALAPMNVWSAYDAISPSTGSGTLGSSGFISGASTGSAPLTDLIALVSLIRRITGLDNILTPYNKTVDKNFQDWVFKKQAGVTKFNEEQMQWLRMIKEYVINSFHIDKEDFDYNPFNAMGGLGKMWNLFGTETEEIINELNEVLAA